MEFERKEWKLEREALLQTIDDLTKELVVCFLDKYSVTAFLSRELFNHSDHFWAEIKCPHRSTHFVHMFQKLLLGCIE